MIESGVLVRVGYSYLTRTGWRYLAAGILGRTRSRVGFVRTVRLLYKIYLCQIYKFARSSAGVTSKAVEFVYPLGSLKEDCSTGEDL